MREPGMYRPARSLLPRVPPHQLGPLARGRLPSAGVHAGAHHQGEREGQKEIVTSSSYAAPIRISEGGRMRFTGTFQRL